MNLSYRHRRAYCAFLVGCFIVTFAIVMALMNVLYQPRCEKIGGEWHGWRGCRVINRDGKVQWVGRP